MDYKSFLLAEKDAEIQRLKDQLMKSAIDWAIRASGMVMERERIALETVKSELRRYEVGVFDSIPSGVHFARAQEGALCCNRIIKSLVKKGFAQ